MNGLDLTTLWISLKTAAAATVLAFVFGTLAAWLMATRRFRGKALVDGLLLAPLVLPPTVVGLGLLLLLGASSAFGRWMERVVGDNLLFSWTAAVIAAAVVAMPLMYRTARGAFEQVDPALPAAARTLGAGEWRVFSRILLPLARPGIAAGTVLTLARAFGEFGATLMIAGNLPGRTRTIPLAIYADVETGALGHAAMWAGLVVLLTVALTTLSNLWLQRAAVAPATSRKGVGESPETSASPLLPPRLAARTGAASAERLLSVELTRHLGPFTLDVAFAARRPLAVLGGSGAGKSLLLRCLSGLDVPDQGRIVLGGRDLFQKRADADAVQVPTRRRRIGHVFQGYALFPHLTVFDNVAFGLTTRTGEAPSLAERQQRVRPWLAAVDVEALAQRFPHQLSGGQAQRVALARALAASPELLLLDEPLAALDTHLRSRLELRLAEIVRDFAGITVLVTHNLEEAFRIADDLLVLDGGRVVAAGPKHDVFAQPGTVAAAVLTGCKNIMPLDVAAPLVRSGRLQVRGLSTALIVPSSLSLAAPAGVTHLGIRANHLRLSAPASTVPTEPNTLPCRAVDVSETPFRFTVQLLCEGGAVDAGGVLLQAEIAKEAWVACREAAGGAGLPPGRLYVTLPTQHLMLLRDDRI